MCVNFCLRVFYHLCGILLLNVTIYFQEVWKQSLFLACFGNWSNVPSCNISAFTRNISQGSLPAYQLLFHAGLPTSSNISNIDEGNILIIFSRLHSEPVAFLVFTSQRVSSLFKPAGTFAIMSNQKTLQSVCHRWCSEPQNVKEGDMYNSKSNASTYHEEAQNAF